MKTELEFIAGPAGWLECQWSRGPLSGTVWVHFRRAGESWEAKRLYTLNPAPAAVRTLPMHRIEVAANAGGLITEQLAARLDEPAPEIGSFEFHEAFSSWVAPEPQPLELKRPPGRRLNDDWYQRVATTYVAAKDRGFKPRTTIAELAGVSTDVAGRWIREARKREHLPPTRPGRVSA